MNPSQLATLKADIAANTNTIEFPTGNPVQIKDLPNNGDANAEIASWYNQLAAAYFAWRTSLGKHELTQESGIDTDGTTVTTFVWGGATGGYIARSQGERDAFKEVFNSVLVCNPSLPNVRTAFNDIFSGTGAGAVGNRAHIWAKGQRAVNRVERLFVIQTVGGPTQSGNRGTRTNPDFMVFEGSVTGTDISNARNLP